MPLSKIIAILDFAKIKGFISCENGEYCCQREKVKTCIITDEKIYLSPISANTLNERLTNFPKLLED